MFKKFMKEFAIFLVNFLKEDKPEDLHSVIRIGVFIVNSIYFLNTSSNNLNSTIVIGLYAIVLGHSIGQKWIQGSFKKNKK